MEISKIINLDELPEEININTITLTFKFNVPIIIKNVGKYITLSEFGIKQIKYGSNPVCLRTYANPNHIIKIYGNSKSFLNQTSMKIYSSHGNYDVTNKLFNNGSCQNTGLRSSKSYIEILNKLIHELTKIKYKVCKDTYKLIPILFVENVTNQTTLKSLISPNSITELTVQNICCGFKLNMNIDRLKLFKLIKSKQIDCCFEANNHPAVIIKYRHDDAKVVSIFVFETGNIIQTGNSTKEQIMGAYNFAIYLLLSNYNELISTNLENMIEHKIIDIEKYINI